MITLCMEVTSCYISLLFVGCVLSVKVNLLFLLVSLVDYVL